MECSGIEEVEEQKVKTACLPIGESKIELLESTSQRVPLLNILKKRRGYTPYCP